MPANFFVWPLNLSLFKTTLAIFSIAAPVCFVLPDCARAEPANCLEILEELELLSIADASEDIEVEVFLLVIKCTL